MYWSHFTRLIHRDKHTGGVQNRLRNDLNLMSGITYE